MKKIYLVVALVLSTWSFASTVRAVGYISYVGLLTASEDRNSDTSNRINAVSGETVNFVVTTQDAQGNNGVLSADPTINTIGNLSGHELKLTKKVAGSWPESENVMHYQITIPSVISKTPVCGDIILKIETSVLTAHNQYTSVVRERTIRACSSTPVITECSDGTDNDNDGAIDYPNDFSCLSADDTTEDTPKSQCQDGKDNDGDGSIDLYDSGCFSSQDNDETEIIATPTPSPIPSTLLPTPSSTASVEPTPPSSPSPTTENPSPKPSPLIGVVVSPSPPSTITSKPLRGMSEAMASATGQPTSAPVTVAATAVAATAAAVSVINLVPSVASASTQTVSSFGNFFFGVYVRKKKKTEHWVKVVDSITGKGIGGSMIQVRTMDGKVRAIWRTDDKTGNTGDLLPPGEYEFVVTKDGWRFPSYIQPVFAKQKDDIIYRRGVIEVTPDGKVIVKGDKNE